MVVGWWQCYCFSDADLTGEGGEVVKRGLRIEGGGITKGIVWQGTTPTNQRPEGGRGRITNGIVWQGTTPINQRPEGGRGGITNGIVWQGNYGDQSEARGRERGVGE